MMELEIVDIKIKYVTTLMNKYHCVCCNKHFSTKQHLDRHCSTAKHKQTESQSFRENIFSSDCLMKNPELNSIMEIVKGQGELLRRQEKRINELQCEIELLKNQKGHSTVMNASKGGTINVNNTTVNSSPTINVILNDFGTAPDITDNQMDKICESANCVVEELVKATYEPEENRNIVVQDMSRDKYKIYKSGKWVPTIDRDIPDQIRRMALDELEKYIEGDVGNFQSKSAFLRSKLEARLKMGVCDESLSKEELKEAKTYEKKDRKAIKNLLRSVD